MKEYLVRGRYLNEDVSRIVSAIHDHFDQSVKHLHFKLTDRRSLTANSQVWVWAQQIAREKGEDSKTEYARMKRDHGLPILLADPEHGELTDWMLKQFKFYSRTDKQQLVIIDGMQVTSLFSTRQHNEFRDSVQSFYNTHGYNLQYLEKDNG
ncbi:hypothetical protein NVP1029O_67 [Vibrio phage 1.029.O._10N.261.55.A7]|nr:hypothetical protein NVP1029O_67 [Vibrio phage 1.029.O._10N.261.55.A7]